MFTQHSIHPASLLVAVIPYFHGQGRGIYQMPYWGAYWHHLEAQIYLGALAISLATAGAVVAWRVKFRPGMFWSITGAISVLLALGKYFPPLAYILYQLPVIGNFRSPNRYWMIVTLACAMLAGYAVDRLLRTEQKDASSAGSRVAIGTSVLITIIVSVICLYVLYVARWDQAGAEFKVPVLSASVSSIVLWLFVRSTSRARLWPLLTLLLIVDFGLYAAYAPIWSTTKPEEIAESSHLTDSRPGIDAGDARSHVHLSVESGEFDPLRFYGIEMATGYDPLINARYKEFSGIDEAGHSHLKTLLTLNDRTLDVLNVRHVIAGLLFADEMRNNTRWREVRPGLFENLHVLPRVWLQRDDEPSNAYDRLRMIRGELEGFLPVEAAFTLRRRSPVSLELDVTVDAPSTLVLSETFWPGWHAKVDGRKTAIRQVDYVLRGIELGAGTHRVEMWYWPWTLTAGLAISFATLIAACITVLRRNLTSSSLGLSRFLFRFLFFTGQNFHIG